MAAARLAWWTEAKGVGGTGPERLAFLGDCGVPANPQVCAWTTMSRLRGRSPRGQRACVSALFGRARSRGMVGAMSAQAAISAVFGPGVWCNGLLLNRSGLLVQARQMNS